MQIRDYLSEILSRIAANPYVESQNISLEERPPDTAYVTGVITFADSSKLHIKEYLILKPGISDVVMYGYNYLSKDDNLIFRYDNAADPAAKKLSTYPEHKHTEKGLSSAKRPALEEILEEIAGLIYI